MVLKLKQDTVTSLLLAMSIMVVAVVGTMTAAVLPSSGGGWFDVTLTSVDADTRAADRWPQGSDGYNSCEVVYRQAAQGGMELAGSSAAEDAVMGELHYAVYTCTGSTLTTGSYI